MNHSARAKSILALLCAMVLAAGLFAIPLNARAEQGVVRVLLTRLNLADRMTIALDGSYSLGDLSFQRGARLMISCVSGKIIVYYEGMALNAGKEITLIRHQTEDGLENGLRINGEMNLYCGDLRVKAGAYSLTAVLHIPVEEYLLGVVPYEMNDAFPLEALKAQAVAARTYALRKTGANGEYDLVDNTNDQVYRGYQASNRRAAQAVADTAGVCGYYKGALANCYYTASNGGQVELPEYVWGKSDGDYITRHEDPYDVENPESMVRKASLGKQPLNGILYSIAFTDAVKAQMTEQLLSLGYTGEAEDIHITAVEGAEAHTPKYGEDSMVMTRLRLTLRVEARREISQAAQDDEDVSIFQVMTENPPVDPTASPEPTLTPAERKSTFVSVSQPIVVELPIFPTVETMLGLSINATQNEIVTVTEEENAYVIAARRFGHGVGMSQRGAQWLAGQYNWTCDQILRFYYPGVEFRQIDTAVTLPPAIAAEYLTTPGPAATPTPRPTLIPVSGELSDGEYRVEVTQIGANSYLNLRSAPSMDAEVLRQLYYGQQLIVTKQMPDGWLQVKAGTLEGYVMEQFVSEIE